MRQRRLPPTPNGTALPASPLWSRHRLFRRMARTSRGTAKGRRRMWPAKPGRSFGPGALREPALSGCGGPPGRRTRTRTSRKQGRYIASRRADRVTDLALDATLREAAPHQRQRRGQRQRQVSRPTDGGSGMLPRSLPAPGPSSPCVHTDLDRPSEGEVVVQRPRMMILWRDDLRQKVRVRQTRNAVCFVVDASWSMAAEERMQATRAAVLSLLRDAYQRRDHVGLVSFQRSYATVLLPLTSSVELAQERLQAMLVGGQTPLARGLLTGFELLDRACKRDPETIPLMVVLTDGQANVAMSRLPPQLESYRVAEMIARHQVRAIVIDTESSLLDDGMGSGGFISAHASRVGLKYTALERGLARQLADHLQGDYYRLEELKAGGLAEMVRIRMDERNPGRNRGLPGTKTGTSIRKDVGDDGIGT
ncbi:MAG: VWA domain-containing protein [Chloroflexaceae bacterium]|nr:VWA domain-containing protein [Chloroflexaceae bacterium]